MSAPTIGLFGLFGRVFGVALVAVTGGAIYMWGSAPPAETTPQPFVLASSHADFIPERSDVFDGASTTRLKAPDLPAPERRAGPAPPAGEDRGAARVPAAVASIPPASIASALKAFASPVVGDHDSDAGSQRTVSRHLAIDAVRLRQADESAWLAISAADVGVNSAVLIGGLAPGSVLSAGTPAGLSSSGLDSWRLSAADFADAALMPPRGFVGVMDLSFELRLADNTLVERKGLQLEWTAKRMTAQANSQPRRFSPADIALMMKTGATYMANGNVGAARMMFQPAAESGEPVAAFALAETYDPLVLNKMGAKGGIASDVALAHSWYEKARKLGSPEAPARIERLARLPE